MDAIKYIVLLEPRPTLSPNPPPPPPTGAQVRGEVVKAIAAALRPELEAAVRANEDGPGTPYEFTAEASARRALKNRALAYLATLDDAGIRADVLGRFRNAGNMTDAIGALSALVDTPGKD